MTKIFISFPFDEVYVATYIAQQLRKNCNDEIEISIYPTNVNGIDHWKNQIKDSIKECEVFIFIVGGSIYEGQMFELNEAISNKKNIWRINTVTGNNAWTEALKKISETEIPETVFQNWDSSNKRLNLDGIVSDIFRIKKKDIKLKYNEYITSVAL
jgi:hypothetical protein